MDCGSLRGVADEVECGISAFVSELEPIGGCIKSYPEDFVVEELPQEELPGEEFLRFSLKKRGVDTLEAIDALAAACRLPAHAFGFAGIKDSFAITSQDLTVCSRLTCEAKIRAALVALPYLRVSHFRYVRRSLRPGHLRGNRFIIRVRGVHPDRVPSAMRALKTKGFVNYVGMQRFGKAGLRSDHLGLAYLQGDYQRCVDLLLRQSGDGGQPKWADIFRRTYSAAAALRKLPEGCCWAERRLLKGLQGTKPWEELVREAFLALPRTIRALYAHSYVDRLWNLAATERMSFGLKLVPGDLLEDEGLNEVVDIANVMLPRPGSGVPFPKNSVGCFMRSYLEYDGLDASELNLEGPVGSFQSLTGCLRPVVARPMDLSYHLEPSSAAPSKDWWEPSKVTRATNLYSRARRSASSTDLLLDFSLCPGQYATMALREVMRPRVLPVPKHIIFESEEEPETPSEKENDEDLLQNTR